MQTIIKLNFDREHFEEIYFQNNQGNYLISQTTKPALITLIISTVLFIPTILFSILYDFYALFFFTTLLFFIISLIGYIKAFRSLYQWKTGIYNFLDREEKYEKYQLVLSNNAFSLIQDDQETIEKWVNFSSVQITNECINLEGKQSFLIPNKSISDENYQVLRKIISEKVK